MTLELDTLEAWLRAQPVDMQLGGNSLLALVIELRAARAVVEAARAHIEDFRHPRTGEIEWAGDTTLIALNAALAVFDSRP